MTKQYKDQQINHISTEVDETIEQLASDANQALNSANKLSSRTQFLSAANQAQKNIIEKLPKLQEQIEQIQQRNSE